MIPHKTVIKRNNNNLNLNSIKTSKVESTQVPESISSGSLDFQTISPVKVCVSIIFTA